jgi:hypoxanthine phosphoribosyltransferase
MSLLEEIKQVERDAELLLSQPQVEAALDRMALEIEAVLSERLPIVLTVLNGGIIFAGQLLPRLNFPLELDSINASRYRGATSGGDIHWLLKPTLFLQDRTVLILDDVLDEGITLAALIAWCQEQGAAGVYTAVLIDKQLGRERPCRADFVGLEAENRYLFGYGMDYKGYLRNAPGIYAVKGL